MVKTLGDYFNGGKIQKAIKKKIRFFDKSYRKAIYVIKAHENNSTEITVFYPYLKNSRIIRDVPLINHLDDPEK